MSSESPYTVVREDTLEDLLREVNRLTKEGYRPIGGVSTFTVLGYLAYLQAMVKPEEGRVVR